MKTIWWSYSAIKNNFFNKINDATWGDIVEHVLLRCQTWNAIRANYFTVTNLSDLFSNVTSRCIVDFIKEIGFYRRVWSPFCFYLVYKKLHLIVEYDHQVMFPSTVFISYVAFPFDVFTLSTSIIFIIYLAFFVHCLYSFD